MYEKIFFLVRMESFVRFARNQRRGRKTTNAVKQEEVVRGSGTLREKKIGEKKLPMYMKFLSACMRQDASSTALGTFALCCDRTLSLFKTFCATARYCDAKCQDRRKQCKNKCSRS
jgi:hypothetical protein